MIHQLHARYDTESRLYLYDDTPKGVFNEPLVRSTTDCIHLIAAHFGWCKGNGDPPERILLEFSYMLEDFEFPALNCATVKLHWQCNENGFDEYLVEALGPEDFVENFEFVTEMGGQEVIALCPHLLDYFDAAPLIFYCQIMAKP